MGAGDTFPSAKAGVERSTLAQRHRATGKPLTAIDVEDEILRFMDMLESTIDELAGRAREAAEAEANYKVKWAGAFLRSQGKNEPARKADADLECHDAYLDRMVKEAKYKSTRELCGSLQAQLDALRTISANLRNQT